MATALKERIRRDVHSAPLSESEKKVLAQIDEYYRNKRLYREGKLAEKPKLPECTQQKYKDMYDK